LGSPAMRGKIIRRGKHRKCVPSKLTVLVAFAGQYQIRLLGQECHKWSRQAAASGYLIEKKLSTALRSML
jgi:hypothetical protein